MKGKKTPAAAGITVYAELSKAGGGITPNAGEDKTAFLVRLTEAVSGLDDAGYDALSGPAQKWFNASGEAINAGDTDKIPDLPGLPEISEEAEASGEETAETEVEQKESTSTKATKPTVNKEPEMNKGKKTPAKAAVKSTKAPAVTPAAKKTVAAKSSARGRVAANADGDAIKVLAKENPKRAGSASFKRFALYAKNKTVGAFLKAGGTRADLRYDTEHKHISVG